MRALDRTLIQPADRQHGVFSREQARRAGLTPSALYKRIKRGDLIVVGTTALQLPGHPLNWDGKLTAGLLDLGSQALVTGRAAAQLLGLDGFDGQAIEYLVPRSIRGRTTVGDVTSTSSIVPLDRETVDGLPCTSATRTVVELLRSGTIEEAGNALGSACRQRRTALAVVRRRLDELGRQGRRGVAAFEQLARMGTVESWLERRFIDLVVRAGLPMPTLQRRYELPGVGVARVDFEYPLWEVVVEVGGRRGYLSLDERRRQERRRNELQLCGKTIYFFTRDDVVGDPSYVVRTIAAALSTEPVAYQRSRDESA